jgi:hypothetical protein
MADDGHFAQAARAWCEEALARLLPDLDRGARCPAFKRTPSVIVNALLTCRELH